MIIAADLDRTLIYSHGALAEFGDDTAQLIPVEHHDGAEASWMTPAAARELATLPDSAWIVPVTTRTRDQYRRITLPGPPSRYAVVANGGRILVDDRPDPEWEAVVAAALAHVAALAEIWDHAARVCRPAWTVKLRNAEGLFCYAVLHRNRVPAGFLAETAAWADTRGWQVSLQGRKLYFVPRALTKSAAVAEIARRTDAGPVLAAGDSLLDADLLEAADHGIVARHGELVASGWTAPHVTVTSEIGVRAGEEIVRWFVANLRHAHPSPDGGTR
jgi:hypothetical protein